MQKSVIAKPEAMSRIMVTAECAVLAALSFALSMIPSPSMPWGGTVSWFATVPVLIAALRHGFGWGTATAMVYSLTQLLTGFGNVMYAYAGGLTAAIGCALLDYVAAYTALGLTGLLYRRSKRGAAGVTVAVLVTGALRLVCSFLSGALIWGSYAWDGWSVVAYSLVYNAAWCVPDVALALIGVLALRRIVPFSAAETDE